MNVLCVRRSKTKLVERVEMRKFFAIKKVLFPWYSRKSGWKWWANVHGPLLSHFCKWLILESHFLDIASSSETFYSLTIKFYLSKRLSVLWFFLAHERPSHRENVCRLRKDEHLLLLKAMKRSPLERHENWRLLTTLTFYVNFPT